MDLLVYLTMSTCTSASSTYDPVNDTRFDTWTCTAQAAHASCSWSAGPWQNCLLPLLHCMDLLTTLDRAAAAARCSYTSTAAGSLRGAHRRHANAAALHYNSTTMAVLQQHNSWRSARITWPVAVATSDTQQRTSSSAAGTANPWTLGFQCNERYLEWDDSSQIKFLRLTLARNQGLSEEQVFEQRNGLCNLEAAPLMLQCEVQGMLSTFNAGRPIISVLSWLLKYPSLHQICAEVAPCCCDKQVDDQLQQLLNLLPDIVGKLESARADVLLVLLRDLPGLADRLLVLREALPGANVSLLVSQQPQPILGMEVQELRGKLAALQEQLPGVNVCALLEQEPMLLAANIQQLLAEVRRLLPKVDAVQYLAANPGSVMSMEAAGLPSTLEWDGSGLV